MPSYARRRNNYSSSAGIQPFSGSGRTLGGYRRSSSLLSRAVNLGGALASAVGPIYGAVKGRSYLKRKFTSVTQLPSSQKPMTRQRSEADGSGGTISKFNYGTYTLALPRSVVKTLMPIYKTLNNSGRITCPVGQQNPVTLFNAFLGSQLATFVGVGGARLIIEGVRAKAMLTNVSNSTCMVTLYDCVASKNINSTDLNLPHLAWSKGFSDEGFGGLGMFLVGATPFGSDAFKQNYHILKKTEFLMGQGTCHTHEIEFFPRKLINQSQYSYNECLKDISVFTMAVIHGVPANDATTLTQVSIGECDLDFVTTKEFQYKTMANAVTTYTGTNALPQAFTVGESIMNVGTGEKDTEEHA